MTRMLALAVLAPVTLAAAPAPVAARQDAIGQCLIDNNSYGTLPYFVIGASDWDMRTIAMEGNGCLRCHRIGMKTLEEFMGDGWHPNEHMPPRDPGSLAEDFEELMECWLAGPENTPSCEWVVPPAGDCASRVVGDDDPYVASFNRARLER